MTVVQRHEKISITAKKTFLAWVDEYADEHGLNRSKALNELVKLGFVVIGADAEGHGAVAELARVADPEALAMLKDYYGDNWI